MRFKTMLVFGLAALGAGACKDKTGITDPATLAPAATIRFVNAVVDTGTVDFRFQDKVENLPMLLGVTFRSTSGFFTRVTPGPILLTMAEASCPGMSGSRTTKLPFLPSK